MSRLHAPGFPLWLTVLRRGRCCPFASDRPPRTTRLRGAIARVAGSLPMVLAGLTLVAGCPREAQPAVTGVSVIMPDDDARSPCTSPPHTDGRGRTIDVRLALPPSVDEREAEGVLAKAAATLALSQLTISLTRPALRLPEGPPLVSAQAPSTTSPEALQAFARASLQPVVALAKQAPSEGPIVVALVPRLFSNRAKVGRFVRGDVDGLTVGHLGGGPDSPLEGALALVSHAPIVLVEESQHAGDTVAHELGHALGLEHTEAPNNLMHAGKRPHCRRVLDDEQHVRVLNALGQR